jgi:putative ABC transport system permease protein
VNSLSLRMLARDWRAGELRVLALALVIAVTSVTSVAFFADRVRHALVGEAHQLIGADALVVSDQPIDPAFRDEAVRRGLAVAQSTGFISMSRKGEEAQLAGIKAVSETYPLRGKLRVASAPNAPDEEARGVPPRGSVWVDERLPATLGAKVGDRIELGESSFVIDRILTLEPDRGVTFFNIAPRLMMNLADVPATQLVQTGSRITYSLFVAGERKTVNEFEAWAKPRLTRGATLQGLENARPEIRAALDRAQQFLGITALLAVILAAVAVGLSTRRYTNRHMDGYAVMRCLGASQARLVRLFAWEFVALGLVACAVGCLLGYVAQAALGVFLAELVQARLPQPGPIPALQGFATGLVLLLGFALPPLLQLRNVPALRVLRRDVGVPKQSAMLGYAAGLAALTALLLWQAGDLKLAGYLLGGFAAAFAVFALASYVALRLAASGARFGNLAWRYGLANLRRRARANTIQILSLAVGLTAILLLTFTRGDLIDTWRAKTPADAPNRFVLNIQPDQRDAVAQFFRDNGLATVEIYPMVRGRLMAVNGQAISAESFEDARTRRLVEREFNLSFGTRLPGHNQVTAGTWFTPEDARRGALSVEEGIARTLGVKVGDVLAWSVGGKTFSAPITNLRKLDWDSMQVNFFVIATPALLADFPASYITSFHLDREQGQAMNRLTQAFPNLTVVDMSAILRQALAVMEQVIRAVQFVFLFALVAGVLVLYAALLATQDERTHEAAVMRALGASRAQVAAAQRAEHLALGLVAGLLAAVGASGIGFVLAWKVFQFDYQMNPWVWIAGPLAGLACVGLNAWLGTRRALSHPPILALREA